MMASRTSVHPGSRREVARSWLNQNLNRKFAAATALGLLFSSLFFLALFVSLYRGQLEAERARAAMQVSRLVQASLVSPSFERAGAELRPLVGRLAEQPGILAVRIADGSGDVQIASDADDLGTNIASRPSASQGTQTRLVEDRVGRAVLRSTTPLSESAFRCLECEDAESRQPSAGFLSVDFDATAIRDKTRATTLLLMGSGAFVVLINVAGGWWFIRRYVIGPVEQLSAASQRLAQGDLDARLQLAGEDEVSVLADRFNGMAAALQEKIGQLEEKELFLQALVDAIPDGIRVLDEGYRVVLSNAAYLDQHGFGDTARVPDRCYAATYQRDSPCPETLLVCPLREVMDSDEPLRVVHRHLRADRTSLDVEIYAAPLRVLRDGQPHRMVVESIRDLEQQVRFSHEQRLSELGRLAAGVAHEIHNPLTSVRMALRAAEQISAASPDGSTKLLEYLELVDHEVAKCEDVTQKLLKLSVPPPSYRELVVVEQVTEETLQLLGWEARAKGVELRFNVDGGPLRVLAADSDLRMVALNLAQNAFHAMPDGGTLEVRGHREPREVVVVFGDTGVGIEPADRVRIFEPFFSRRADGVRGTGLGLSITKAIIESHGGKLEVDSVLGRGSRFTVRFPDADAESTRG